MEGGGGEEEGEDIHCSLGMGENGKEDKTFDSVIRYYENKEEMHLESF